MNAALMAYQCRELGDLEHENQWAYTRTCTVTRLDLISTKAENVQ